jgi:hypothetical protein
MREPRLGDIIDDYCIKCKRIMNHAVVSLLNGEPAKVRCRTCHNDHDYRHEQAPPPKTDTRKQTLFNEVLAKVPTAGTPLAAAGEPLIEDVSEDEFPDETADEAGDEDAPPAPPAPAAKAPAKPAKTARKAPPAKPKAKSAAKGRK